MKIRNVRPSPALVIALIALFVTLGGSAFAVTSSDRAASRGKLTLRFGKLVDRDTTPFDGSRNIAFGHAICAKGERVISGGPRQVAGGAGVVPHVWTVESNPVPSKRGWFITMSSDLGGAARKDFRVVANCEQR